MERHYNNKASTKELAKFSKCAFRNFFVQEKCTVGRNTLIYFNTNYRTEMKLGPVIMDYCVLQLNIINFF